MRQSRFEQAFLAYLCTMDVLITVVSWLASYFISSLAWSLDFYPQQGETPPFWWCLRTVPAVILVSLLSYRLSGLYQLGRRWPLWQEVFHVLKATGLMLLLLVATTFFARNPYESRLASVIFLALTSVGLVLGRRCWGIYFRLRRRWGLVDSKALIVGTGRLAKNLDVALRSNNWMAMEPMGFIDDGVHSSVGRATQTVGGIEDLPKLVEEHGINCVFVALPLSRYAATKKILRLLRDTLVEVRLIPDVPALTPLAVQIGELEGLPTLNLRSSPYSFLDGLLKRTVDVVFASLGLVVISPLMGLIALIVKLSDGGPIFYGQERMGLDGRKFLMLKFRSMRVNAETESGPVWASQGDQRRTRFGAFLRETSLDELPQLFNVLRGDMSLVGPRPERPYFINNFRESIPKYMLRHSVKAGITGWAQVNGWRGNTSLRKRIQYDLYYITNWSIWFDFRILFMTVRAMWDKHAY
ncbi:UDP-glucose:undecaprenyl-phosphate glucose-1-phosphate transferase [Planctomycetes bacterium Pan216]|uniref:UDP-glucose:undecaprenyl-phosphate glucose-1-phosphate transferase n=1 Tax=Kolteria novifilia TaxID=2527975 RepID=A0A518BAN2_9BACT|nr:UDP-glucose:undecaprenyl-phosphate glucose-1-phosphate transferase [Planctomycetes bacterium Pan216]